MSGDAMMIDRLELELRRHPHRPALVGRSLAGRAAVSARAGDVIDVSDSYAAALHERGLRAGDTVGFAAALGVRPLAVLLAARRLGLRVAVLDPTAGPDVLLARLRLAEPRLILADAAAQALAGWARPLGRWARLELPRLSALGPVATIGAALPGCAPRLVKRLRSGRSTGRAGRGTPEDRRDDGDAVVIFTSGTTSRPRAVVHTWTSLDAILYGLADLVRPSPGEVVLGSAIFVHIPALVSGAAIAMPARSGRAMARQYSSLRPGQTYLTPPQLRSALAAGAQLTGRVWTGSAPVSAQLLRRCLAAGAREAWGVYALTELVAVAAVEAREKLAFDGPGDLVGGALPGVRVTIGTGGELLVAGAAACDRYLGESTTEWIATGDLGELVETAAGTRIVLAGRCKDMVLRGAENIYPGLYEPALHIHGVNLAVLVAVPGADRDECLVAVVEPAAGADRAQLLAALEPTLARMGAARPDHVLFATIPLAGRSHKPDRRATSELAAEALARSVGPRVARSGRAS